MPRLWAVFDLDGTLCDCTHRVEHAHRRDFETFHSLCATDPPYRAEVMLAQAWYWAGGCVAFNTGRTAPYRVLTLKWLADQKLPKGPLFMRELGDDRATEAVKYDALVELEKKYMAPGDSIAFIMEDKQKLVDMWRRLGYTCFQPRPSAF